MSQSRPAPEIFEWCSSPVYGRLALGLLGPRGFPLECLDVRDQDLALLGLDDALIDEGGERTPEGCSAHADHAAEFLLRQANDAAARD
jgi:hypothetical protein